MAIDLDTPVENLSDVEVDQEINELYQHDGYLGNGLYSYLPEKRQPYLDRMANLYARKHPESQERRDLQASDGTGLYDRLKEENVVSGEELKNEAEAALQKMADERAEIEYQQAESELKQAWGDDYQQNLSLVYYFVDQAVTPEDQKKLVEHFGNDPKMMDAIAIVSQRLDPIFWDNQGKNYKRKEQE